MPRLFFLITVWLLGVLTTTAVSFKILPSRWPEPRTTFSTGALPETFRNAVNVRAAMNDAAANWTAMTGFTFQIAGNNPACDVFGTLLNGAEFFPRACDGSLLGPATLAVTESISDGNGETLAAGITFNSELDWATYDGPARFGEPDFRRVALHELGHVASLDHEDGLPSIMSSRVDDTISLQPDDLAGIKAAYPELAGFEPPVDDEIPPVPTASCSRNLAAFSRFCKSLFACLASNASDPTLGTRVGCTAGAEANFVSGNGCADSANSMTNNVFFIDEGVAAGIDGLDKNHRKFHSKVLKQGGKQCSKALKAEAKNIKKPNVSKLNAARSKARLAFVKKGIKALAKGESQGNSYDGPSIDEIKNQIDALVDETVDNVVTNP